MEQKNAETAAMPMMGVGILKEYGQLIRNQDKKGLEKLNDRVKDEFFATLAQKGEDELRYLIMNTKIDLMRRLETLSKAITAEDVKNIIQKEYKELGYRGDVDPEIFFNSLYSKYLEYQAFSTNGTAPDNFEDMQLMNMRFNMVKNKLDKIFPEHKAAFEAIAEEDAERVRLNQWGKTSIRPHLSFGLAREYGKLLKNSDKNNIEAPLEILKERKSENAQKNLAKLNEKVRDQFFKADEREFDLNALKDIKIKDISEIAESKYGHDIEMIEIGKESINPRLEKKLIELKQLLEYDSRVDESKISKIKALRADKDVRAFLDQHRIGNLKSQANILQEDLRNILKAKTPENILEILKDKNIQDIEKFFDKIYLDYLKYQAFNDDSLENNPEKRAMNRLFNKAMNNLGKIYPEHKAAFEAIADQDAAHLGVKVPGKIADPYHYLPLTEKKEKQFRFTLAFNETIPVWHDKDEIIPNLMLGRIPQDMQALINSGVKLVVSVVTPGELASVRFNTQQLKDANIEHIVIVMDDFGGGNVNTAQIAHALSPIHQALLRDEKVLIHCKAGRARSAMVLAAVLQGFGLRDDLGVYKEYQDYLDKKLKGKDISEIPVECDLYKLKAFPESSKELKKYCNNYILVGKELRYVNANGGYEQVKIKDFANFSKLIDSIFRNPIEVFKNKIHLSNEILHKIMETHVDPVESYNPIPELRELETLALTLDFIKTKRPQANLSLGKRAAAIESIHKALALEGQEQEYDSQREYLASEKGKFDVRQLTAFKELGLYAIRVWPANRELSNFINNFFKYIETYKGGTEEYQARLDSFLKELESKNIPMLTRLANNFREEFTSLVNARGIIDGKVMEALPPKRLFLLQGGYGISGHLPSAEINRMIKEIHPKLKSISEKIGKKEVLDLTYKDKLGKNINNLIKMMVSKIASKADKVKRGKSLNQQEITDLNAMVKNIQTLLETKEELGRKAKLDSPGFDSLKKSMEIINAGLKGGSYQDNKSIARKQLIENMVNLEEKLTIEIFVADELIEKVEEVEEIEKAKETEKIEEIEGDELSVHDKKAILAENNSQKIPDKIIVYDKASNSFIKTVDINTAPEEIIETSIFKYKNESVVKFAKAAPDATEEQKAEIQKSNELGIKKAVQDYIEEHKIKDINEIDFSGSKSSIEIAKKFAHEKINEMKNEKIAHHEDGFAPDEDMTDTFGLD